MSLASAVAAPAVLNIADLRRSTTSTAVRTRRSPFAPTAPSFDEVLFRPRGAVASPRASLETTVLGQRFSLPFLLAPVGSTRLLYPKGEVQAAGAAAAAGIAFILSTLGGTSLEEV
jgi:L-lactate dehydrogenase (cytochrome)